MDDNELIAAVAAGDGTALRVLFTRHAPWLVARLRVALPPPDVEDVLQETFLAVWRGASAYRPQGTPRAWMWVIACNQAALLLRPRGPVAESLPRSRKPPRISPKPPWSAPRSQPPLLVFPAWKVTCCASCTSKTIPSLLLPWLISTVVAFGVGDLVSIGPGSRSSG